MGCKLNMKKQLIRRSAFDGIIRAVALLVLIDFATSTYYIALNITYREELFAIACMPATIAFILSAVPVMLSYKKYRSEFKTGKYIIISAITFVVSIFIFELLNNSVLSLRLFPIRELSNVDGIVIIIICSAFLISNLIGRITAIAVIWLKAKSN